MPNNYVALSDTPEKAECAAIITRAGMQIEPLFEFIKKGERVPDVSISLKDRIISGPVCGLFYTLFVHDKGFAVHRR